MIEKVCNESEVGSRAKFRKHRKSTPKTIKVINTVLLYSIVDAGFLHTHLANIHKDEEGNKAFYFKRCDDIQDMVNNFNLDDWQDYEAYTRNDYCLW